MTQRDNGHSKRIGRFALGGGVAVVAVVAAALSAAGPVAAATAAHPAPLRVVSSSPTPTGVYNGVNQGGIGARRIVNGAATSTNWSGYAVARSVTAVSSQWSVPAVVAATPTAYSSTWIGVDGYSNSNLIQTGTSQDSNGSYYAWWEILPAAETRITGTVRPGDAISASVSQTSSTTWQIKLTDSTEGWVFDQPESYSGPHASAEWIEEAPTVAANGHAAVATLANYGSLTFAADDVATTSAALGSTGTSITLVTSGAPNSVPSAPSASGDTFATTWTDPAAAPATSTGTGRTGTASDPNTKAARSAPSAPVRVRALRSGTRAATLAWAAPSGASVLRYVVRLYAGSRLVATYRVPAWRTGTRVRSLPQGHQYSFTVAAVNSAGQGAFSARSNSVRIAS